MDYDNVNEIYGNGNYRSDAVAECIKCKGVVPVPNAPHLEHLKIFGCKEHNMGRRP